MKKTLFCIIICASLLFVACEPIDKVVSFFADDGTGYIFKTSLPSDPENLDPQLCNDPSGEKICKNLYAGLMGYDSGGKLTQKLARDYTISEDGLSYTFYLIEGLKWHALGNYEHDLTADDFVYGFRRLMDPKTASPHSEKYFCIKNAEAARNGFIDVSEIGVSAPDKLTVVFTLEYPCAEFLHLLAELPAMPCCEDFFITSGGKYGLEAEAVCSNGPFFVRYWLHDPYGKSNYVRLRRNPGYSDVIPVSAGGVNYLITSDEEQRLEDFNSGATDVLTFSPGEAPKTDGSELISGFGGTAGLVFGKKSKIFSSNEVREVFSWAIDRAALKDQAPDILGEARSLVPPSDSMYLRGYTSRVPEGVCETDISMAEYKWGFLLSEREKASLIGMSIMVPSDFGYSDYLTAVTDSWYEVFSVHIPLDIVNPRDYAERLKSGDYDIALAILEPGEDGAADFIKPFGSKNRFGWVYKEALEAENIICRSETLSALNYAVSEAENAVLSDHTFIPIWYLPSAAVFDDDCEDLGFDPFGGTVYFENAKHF